MSVYPISWVLLIHFHKTTFICLYIPDGLYNTFKSYYITVLDNYFTGLSNIWDESDESDGLILHPIIRVKPTERLMC